MAHGWIGRIWQRKGLFGRVAWLFLSPFSAAFRLAVQFRNSLYTRGWLRIETLDRPVISIGNLTVGGTGKTPAVLWLARELGALGLRVAILSRGYKRESAEPVVLLPECGEILPAAAEAGVAAAGDEPFMMARLYGQMVGVCRERYRAGQALLRMQDVDVFLLDDGFQHRRLKRDVDVLVLGGDCGGSLLPAGPFREPKAASERADYFVVTGAPDQWQPLLRGARGKTWFPASLQAQALVGLESNRWKEQPLSLLYGSKILAVSAVANPEGLYRIIQDWDGKIVDALEFPDHHVYTPQDWQRINRLGRHVNLVVTTEKDLIKLIRFPFAKNKLMAVKVALTVENGDELVRRLAHRVSQPVR